MRLYIAIHVGSAERYASGTRRGRLYPIIKIRGSVAFGETSREAFTVHSSIALVLSFLSSFFPLPCFTPFFPRSSRSCIVHLLIFRSSRNRRPGTRRLPVLREKEMMLFTKKQPFQTATFVPLFFRLFVSEGTKIDTARPTPPPGSRIFSTR